MMSKKPVTTLFVRRVCKLSRGGLEVLECFSSKAPLYDDMQGLCAPVRAYQKADRENLRIKSSEKFFVNCKLEALSTRLDLKITKQDVLSSLPRQAASADASLVASGYYNLE